MKSTFKKLPGSKIALEIILTADEFKPYWQAAREKALAAVEIKGFRKGMAPKEVAEQAVNRDRVFEDAVQEAVRFSLDEARSEREWVFVDSPKIEVLDAAPVGEAGLRYKADLTVFPEITMGDYKKIARKVLAEKHEITVTDDEVSQSIDWLRKSRATITRASHEARPGDLVEARVESRMSGQEKPAESADDKFVLGESHWPEGFDRKLEGRRAGETIDFSLTPPLSKKQADFKVTIKSIFDRSVPPLDDQFAQGLGENFKSLDDVRKSVREGLLEERTEREHERKRAKILSEIRAASKIDVPEIMIEKQLRHLVEEFKVLAPGNDRSDEELRTALRERARETVETHLIIYSIAKNERLEPRPEEVLEEITRQRLDRDKYYDYIYNTLQNKKLFAFLESQHG